MLDITSMFLSQCSRWIVAFLLQSYVYCGSLFRASSFTFLCRYLLAILTTHVKKTDPALEKTLTIIKDLKGTYCLLGNLVLRVLTLPPSLRLVTCLVLQIPEKVIEERGRKVKVCLH